ncbi:MAG: polysaccharide deacetylase family protein [Planctomycetaceae bacterium]
MRSRFTSELKSRFLAATGLLRASETAAAGAAILMYHGVFEKLRGDLLDEYCLTADDLRLHIRFLKSQGEIVSLRELIDRLRSGLVVPNDWFVITFDDALQCQARLAREVLAAESVPWTLAVPTDVIELRRSVWNYEARTIVLTMGRDEMLALPGSPVRTLPLRTDNQRIAAASALVDRLAKVGDGGHRNEYLAQLVARIGLRRLGELMSDDGRFVSATWEEIRTLDREGVTIAAHGASHVLQHSGMDDEVLRREIHGSREVLQQHLGRGPFAFVLPGGRRAPHTDRFVREAGYECCLGSRPARVVTGADLFDLPRFDAAFSLPTLRRHLCRNVTM